jgi:hypothetical protein
MRILLERSGGFAAIKKKATVDSEALSPEESAELKKLVDAAGVFDLPAAPDGPPQGADQFQYNLTIETPEGRHAVVLRDPTSPELKRLLDWVWAHKQQE